MKLFVARAYILILTHPFESLFGLPLALFFGWYMLALCGLFYPLFTLPIALIVALGIFYLLSKKPAFCHLANILLMAFIFFFALFAFISHPVELVSEGRDQGTFVTTALLINEYHGLSFSLPEAKPFFAIYGKGKALNFPGLAYTNTGALISEFPLGYSVWLAGFVSIFGLLGFSVANAVLYLLSGMLMYALLKRVAPVFWSFIGTLAAMGGFLPLWFLSFTLSENLALFLFLLTVESLLRFQISKDNYTLFLGLTSAFALALTRIEGWAMLAIVFLIVTFKKPKKVWLKKHLFSKPGIRITWVAAVGIISIWTLFVNLPYYKAIFKALRKTADQNIVSQNISTEAYSLYQVLWEYGILLVFVMGLLGCLYFWKRKMLLLLIPLFLALPTIPYLLLPHITLDAPWMLRRFLFSLYPALFISTIWAASLLFQRYSEKKRAWAWTLLFVIIIGVQIPALKSFSMTYYSATLLPQVEELSRLVSSTDLLLVDREVTGDNFMIPARALTLFYQRPSVYFFNPADLTKIDASGYGQVYLLVPTEKIPLYEAALGKRLEVKKEFTFFNDHSFRGYSAEGNNLPKNSVVRTPVSLIAL